jgi:asparagine synthase (glutamine-hydrolysing)
MGGLAGIVHFDGTAPDRGALARVTARLAHRGPDSSGTFFEGAVALGHRRRAVVPTRSRQPLVTPECVVLLDGWLYDHLKTALAAGDARTTLTDVQALALAWRKWGTSLVNHLDGDFAVAIWDRRDETLHLLRDRLGSRPLYWVRDGARFAFASELPALLELPWVGRDLDGGALSEYLSFRVVHAPRTLLRSVKQVEASHWLRVRQQGLDSRAYWRIPYAPAGAAPERAASTTAHLQEILDEAVRRRLADGAPAALYLSGGLGSTAIAASARKLHRNLPSYTIGFADDQNPEAPFAGRVAKLLGLEHHDVTIGSAELADSFSRAVRALGHPIGSPAALLLLLLAERVADDARVVLTGDGSVELFGGRMLDTAVRGLRRTTAIQRLPGPLRGPASRVLSGVTVGGDRVDLFGLAREIGGSDLFNLHDRRALLARPDFARPLLRHEVLVRFYEEADTDPINAMLHAYLCSWLREEGLVRADRTAAHAGLDARFPLLDREVVEAAAALPGPAKIGRGAGSLRTRWPLRALLHGVIPPPLLNRPKRGLPAPLDAWLAGPGRLFMDQRLGQLVSRTDLFRPQAVVEIKHRVPHEPSAGLQLWSLFILDEWLREVVGA